MARSLKEAIEIYQPHMTPAEKLEMRLREKRNLTIFTRQNYERLHELKHPAGGPYDKGSQQSNVVMSSTNSDWQCSVSRRFSEVFRPDAYPDAYAVVGERLYSASFSFDMKGDMAIPEWANWMAVNASGAVDVYHVRPLLSMDASIDVWCHGEHAPAIYERIANVGPRHDWRDTLCPLTKAAWQEWTA